MRRSTAVFLVLALSVGQAVAQGTVNQAGRVLGDFSSGVTNGITENLQSEWITVAPRSKDECMAESGGVVNPVFMRCRNGRQEQVRTDSRGNRKVIRERPIPMQ